ncbi:hypothetical protein PR202_ga30243 [Eleusine coracana subsp. coracana]|uniref:ATP synthase subunit e, mitochondrial n=1 Tax=Eleusine coracana subsp. coracana TaxID=191504 RepID=A0AAV5DNC9_ELECO|nr:hypothetical protein PR202_ga30243 [Eleusine coracana subsp. coracana]
MPFTPGPYSGVSTLALVARASAFGVGVVYGTIKLSILKSLFPVWSLATCQIQLFAVECQDLSKFVMQIKIQTRCCLDLRKKNNQANCSGIIEHRVARRTLRPAPKKRESHLAAHEDQIRWLAYP